MKTKRSLSIFLEALAFWGIVTVTWVWTAGIGHWIWIARSESRNDALVFMPPHYIDDQRQINERLFSCLNIFYGVPSRATLRRTSANLRSTVKASTTSIYPCSSYSHRS